MKLFYAIQKALGMTLLERIDNAINRAANLASEADKYKMRELYYSRALRHVDPHQEWNVFAHFKQKQYDARQEFETAQRKFVAAQERVHKLLDESISPFHVVDELADRRPTYDGPLGEAFQP